MSDLPETSSAPVEEAPRKVKNPLSPEGMEKLAQLEKKYPEKRSVLMQALHLCQEEQRHIPESFIHFIAPRVGYSPAHVVGVATFYEMYTDTPVGRNLIQICKTLPCHLRGTDNLLHYLEKKLAIRRGQTTEDGRFTLMTVECLACCDRGPVMMINDDLHGDLDRAKVDALLEACES